MPECTSVSSTKLQGWAPDSVVIALVGCGDKVSSAMTARTVVLMRQSDLGATKSLLVGTTKTKLGATKFKVGATTFMFRSDKNTGQTVRQNICFGATKTLLVGTTKNQNGGDKI